MKVCIVGKYPPIEGGVSASTYWTARVLAEQGHQVHVVTNAEEIEPEFRMWMDEEDRKRCEGSFEGEGFVRVNYAPQIEAGAYIPWANPFVTKLAGMVTEVVRRERCKLIYAYYFEPYGMAAHLASAWTGVPYVIQHAGTDLGRLMQIQALGVAYRELLLAATAVITSSNQHAQRFQEIGVAPDRIVFMRNNSVPTDCFNPEVVPLDVNKVIAEAEGFVQAYHLPRETKEAIVAMNAKSLCPETPTIGIYGKVGETKGSFDLVKALARIKSMCSFNFLAIIGGRPGVVKSFVGCIQESDLADRTWLLPFVPHWRVPSFIRRCSLVCFLERDFPITFHAPKIAREVLACGVCLVCSGEIVNKQAHSAEFISGKNLVIVEDPKKTDGLGDSLLQLLLDENRRLAIGCEGHKLSQQLEDFSAFKAEQGALFTRLLGLALTDH